MPVKWKIFFVLNFVLVLPAIYFLAHLIASLYRDAGTGEYNTFFFLFATGLLIIILNSFLNIYVLQRFFPDKLMSRGIKTLNILLLVLTGITTAGSLFICIYGAAEESGSGWSNDSGKIVLVIMFVFLVAQVLVFLLQLQLPGRINRNHKNKMNSLIDSIGQ